MFFRDIVCFFVVLLFVPSFYEYVECALVIKPQNVAAMSGTVIALSCSSDVSKGNIAWNTISPGSSSRDIIYNDKVLASSVSSYISVSDRDDGNCTLNINASLTAAKRYICMERDSGQEASADLVVMESPSKCNSAVTANNSVNVNCTIISAGNWASTAICKQYDGTGENILEGKQVENIWNFHSNNASHEIYCWTKFEKSGGSTESNSASNVPNDIWIHAYKPTPIKTPDGYGYAIAITVTVIVTIGLTLLVGISMILLWHFGHKNKGSRHEEVELNPQTVALSNSTISSSMVPSYSVVAIGAGANFNCTINKNDSIQWTYTSWNTSTDTSIYLGKDIVASMRSRYKIDKSISGQHNLIIDSVDLAHAGRYRCTGVKNQSPMNDIQLVVLGSHPVCAANISDAEYEGKEPMNLTLWCKIIYAGNPNPVFKWTKSNEQENILSSTFGTRIEPLTTISLIMQPLQANDSGVTFQCQITFQNPSNSEEGPGNVYSYSWNYPLSKDSGGTQEDSGIPFVAIAIGGSLLLLLIIAIIVSCVVHRKRLKDDTSERPDVALNTDINAYDELTLSSGRSPNFILEENRSPEKSDSRTIADNAVYSEVWKPHGRSNGNSGGNICNNASPHQTPTRKGKNLIGADGTEYAELSGVKPPSRKGELPKPPAFSRVEVYAAIDHNGKAPPPPPRL